MTPLSLSHVRAWLRSPAGGVTSYLEADARDTQASSTGRGRTLDLGKPVGLLMIMVLNFLEDAGDTLARLAAAVPSGSYLAVVQPARDERTVTVARRWNQLGAAPVFLRDRDEVARLAGRPGTGRARHRRGAPVAAGARRPGLSRGHAAARRRRAQAVTATRRIPARLHWAVPWAGGGFARLSLGVRRR